MSKNPKKCNLSCVLCSCFTGNNETSEEDFEHISENEPFDYVVEKLCIKKLPLRTFATAEDVENYNKKLTLLNEVASPMTRQDLIAAPSNITFRKNLGGSSKAFRYQPSPKPVSINDKEGQIVAKILNKHASLYTLDDKNPIPKDPFNPPRDRVLVPESVSTVLRRNATLPPLQVPVEVLHRPTSSFKYPTNKKRMTRDIEKTINALRVAPRSPTAVQPRNQISAISVTPVDVNESTESESSLYTSSQASLLLDTNTVFNYIKSNDPESIMATVDLETRSSIDNKQSVDSLEVNHDEDEQGSQYDSKSQQQLPFQNFKWKIIIKRHSDKTQGASKVENFHQ
ncbi:hypothetical protein PPYR_08344 [Photinus pyralis]|uniref:Uncharacterized protein n=1 Tax=Photinus pyralis TaxID=7054 RepID=A0A5N4AJ23_PHOPY|nr:uncharacterized protein LOC116172654 [Photinus pyralis]KAB0797350.1 hypothetical protein PPYR_08344 [Photinus pyralis]